MSFLFGLRWTTLTAENDYGRGGTWTPRGRTVEVLPRDHNIMSGNEAMDGNCISKYDARRQRHECTPYFRTEQNEDDDRQRLRSRKKFKAARLKHGGVTTGPRYNVGGGRVNSRREPRYFTGDCRTRRHREHARVRGRQYASTVSAMGKHGCEQRICVWSVRSAFLRRLRAHVVHAEQERRAPVRDMRYRVIRCVQ